MVTPLIGLALFFASTFWVAVSDIALLHRVSHFTEATCTALRNEASVSMVSCGKACIAYRASVPVTLHIDRGKGNVTGLEATAYQDRKGLVGAGTDKVSAYAVVRELSNAPVPCWYDIAPHCDTQWHWQCVTRIEPLVVLSQNPAPAGLTTRYGEGYTMGILLFNPPFLLYCAATFVEICCTPGKRRRRPNERALV